MEVYVYMVGACPPGWLNTAVARRCHRHYEQLLNPYVLDVPVISLRTNWTYVNIFCARCHNDTSELAPNTIQLNCSWFLPNCLNILENSTYRPKERFWTHEGIPFNNVATFSVTEQKDPWKLMTNHGLRRCRKVKDKCDNRQSEEEVQLNCLPYANYSYVDVDALIYKNPSCVACNEGTSDVLNCNLSFVSFVQSMPQTVRSGASFALLLDFNEMHGEYVGTTDFQKFKRVNYNKENHNMSDEATNASAILQCDVMAVYPPNYSVVPDGPVHIHSLGLVVQKGEYVLPGPKSNTSAVWICYEDDAVNPFWRFSVLQSHLTLGCLGLSVSCLAAHIAIYCTIPKLRNLPGKNLMSLAASLLVAQLLFLGVDQVPYQGLCEAMAVMMHFTFLAAFFWMNIMAIDVCRTFTSPFYQHDPASQAKNYRRYSGYAWALPAVIVAIALLLEHSRMLPSLSPRYGIGFCWITRRRALLIFFALPMAVLLLENIIFFGLTARGIYRTVKAAQVARRRSDRVRFYLYIKLALLMGLGWVLGFVAAYANSEPLWIVFILLNASQGVFILVAFSLKLKVLRLLFERLPCRLRKRLQGNLHLQIAATSATNLTMAITKLSSSSCQLNRD